MLNLEQLATIGSGRTLVTLHTETRPKLLRKGRESGNLCPWADVVKIAARVGWIGVRYEDEVNDQRVREGRPDDFQAGSLWAGAGEWVPGSQHLVRHRTTGKLYLAFRATAAEFAVYLDAESGAEIDPDTLTEFLPQSKPAANQGVESEVVWRTIAIENVTHLEAR